MFTIPKLSAPLTKAIRTSEGIMVWAVNVGTVAFTLLESSKLPPKEAGIIVAANTAFHGGYRTLLKVIALQKGVGIGEPIAPAGNATESTKK
jgi:hypothetical protein